MSSPKFPNIYYSVSGDDKTKNIGGRIIDRLSAMESKIDAILEALAEINTAKPVFVSVKEASKQLGIPVYRLREMCLAGDIPCNRIGTGSDRLRFEIDVKGARERIAANIEYAKMLAGA